MPDADGFFIDQAQSHFIARIFEREAETIEAADDVGDGRGRENGNFLHKS